MKKKFYNLLIHDGIRQNCITYYVLMTIHKEILQKVSINNKSYHCDYNEVQKQLIEIDKAYKEVLNNDNN